MCGRTRRNRIRNEVIQDKMGVVSVEDNMQEARLRWFVHVKMYGCLNAEVSEFGYG